MLPPVCTPLGLVVAPPDGAHLLMLSRIALCLPVASLPVPVPLAPGAAAWGSEGDIAGLPGPGLLENGPGFAGLTAAASANLSVHRETTQQPWNRAAHCSV